MKLSHHRMLKLTLILSCSAALFFLVGVNQFAQIKTQIPTRTGDVNDFAGVIDEKTRLQLATILENVKQKTGIEFALVTIELTAGQDISDYSRLIAQDWNIGALTSSKKSLLLVLAVNEKTSFTRFSRPVQGELPEGVLGGMAQRMRTFVNAGQFSGGLSAGLRYFVNSMAEKHALNAEDFYKVSTPVSMSDSPLSKPAGETVTSVATPATSESSRPAVRSAAARDESRSRNTIGPTASSDDDDESEEVELTLTDPLEARVVNLKAFIERRPDSKSKPRAIELLVSAHAALGDERLKKGDSAGGTEQLMLAIAAAPVNASEKLFSGVISQIPLNLYLRGQRAAATKAAQNIEAKFGADPKRLLAIAGFYMGTEQGGEAARLAAQAVNLAPESPDAHQALGLALHISLRLDEAVGEYKRTLELDPNSKAARRGLADLSRASGKAEEALALYRQQLVAEPNDKGARAGMVLSLLDLGRADEAKTELATALNTDPRNLALLAGAAYWFAAHGESERAFELGSKAVEIEPRYTWSHVALARALMTQKKPLEAERALRFARQYGKFPTLDYELASALAVAGLYEEAAEILMQTFSLKDGQIEVRLAGRAYARSANFIDLLAPERRASIFQFAAADTENNAKTLKALLDLATALNQEKNERPINEEHAIAAAKEFAAGGDAARVHRQLYAASRLVQRGIGFPTAFELAEAARSSADAGMSVPALTVAIQADEFREIRARAIAAGGTPDIPEAPRNVLSNLLRGRIEDLSGWALFNQDKLDEAVEHLKRAANILPEGTPAWRTSLWHLGAALDRLNKKEEALGHYVKSYNSGEPDPVRRTVIERLYRTVHGSLAGLDELIRQAPASTAVDAPAPARDDTAGSPAQPASSPEITPKQSNAVPVTPAVEPSVTPIPTLPDAPAVPTPQATPSPEVSASPTPEPPTTSPTPSPEATPAQSPTPVPETPPSTSPPLGATPVETMDKSRPTVVTIKGRVKDSRGNPIANVVVVLISPQGTVLASTTDDEGNYKFTVAPSPQSYRIIPSKDGFRFEPVDKLLAGVSEDQNEMDFVAASRAP